MKAVTAVKLLFLLLPFVSGEKKSSEAPHGSSADAKKVEDPPSSVSRGLRWLEDSKTQTEDKALMKMKLQEPSVDRHDHLRHQEYDQHRHLSTLTLDLSVLSNPKPIVINLVSSAEDFDPDPHQEYTAVRLEFGRDVKVDGVWVPLVRLIKFFCDPDKTECLSPDDKKVYWSCPNGDNCLPWVFDEGIAVFVSSRAAEPKFLTIVVHRIDIDSTSPAKATICLTWNANSLCCEDSDYLVNGQIDDYLCRCEGDCDSDMDCVDDLVCFTRDGDEEVPGCSGAGSTGKDYCTDRPNPNYLAYVGNSGRPADAFPLGLCEADCDSDSDCNQAADLCCFKRKKFTPVPQCDGAGARGKDYCIQDNWESDLVFDNVPWNLLHGHLMAPTYAYNATGNAEFNSLLDDFTVPVRHVWTINQFRWTHFWSGGDSEIGVGVELSILEDNNGVPGDVIHAHIDIASYTEVDTGNTLPNNNVHTMDSTATFTSPLVLQPGTYWFESYILVDPSYHGSNSAKNWWLCGDKNDATAGWYNYTDGEGLQPSWCNLNFILKGTVATDCSL